MKDKTLKYLSEKMNLPIEETKKMLNATLDELTDILVKGETFIEPGFGSFSISKSEKKNWNRGFNSEMDAPTS